MFTFTHYPLLLLILFLVLLLMIVMKLCPQKAWIFSILSGFFCILFLIMGLYYSLPLEEIFLLFLVISLMGFRVLPKEEQL